MVVIYENIVMTSELSTYFFPFHGGNTLECPAGKRWTGLRSSSSCGLAGCRVDQKGKQKYHPEGVEGSKINRPYWIVVKGRRRLVTAAKTAVTGVYWGRSVALDLGRIIG